MKGTKKLLSAILAGVMILSMAGCSSKAKIKEFSREQVFEVANEVFEFDGDATTTFEDYVLLGPNLENPSYGDAEYIVKTMVRGEYEAATIYYYEFATVEQADAYFNALYVSHDVANADDMNSSYSPNECGYITNGYYMGEVGAVYFSGNKIVVVSTTDYLLSGWCDKFVRKMGFPN